MTKVRKFNTFQKGLEDFFVNLMLGCLFLCVFLLLKGKRPLLCQTVTCQPKDTLKFCSVPEKKEEKNSPLLFFIYFVLGQGDHSQATFIHDMMKRLRTEQRENLTRVTERRCRFGSI